nr:L-tyrosine decarboxylase-like [Hydra vulgaris]
MVDENIPKSDVYSDPWNAIAAWFLGPRAENRESLNRLVLSTLNFYEDCRESYYPADPCYITEEVKASPGFRGELKDLEKKLGELNDELADSIPFYSTRYQGHMTAETTIRATLGYFVGMLWNQNNVDSSASPVTTQMEILVGKHLCDLIQFSQNNPTSWAHITSCGSVANIEALWSARNLKFHPLAIKACVMDVDADPKLKAGANMPVYLAEIEKEIPLQECSQWQLLNLDVDTVCNLTSNLKTYCKLENTKLIDAALKKHSVISIGLANFMHRQKLENSPVIFCPGTCHYSYPKAATILGLGDQNIIPLEADCNCRVRMAVLRSKLERHLELKIPIITVVAVISSTEESAIDPISEMFEMRKEFQKRGLSFTIHADAAWGGYMLTMICDASADRLMKLKDLGFVPEIPLSEYATYQYQSVKLADTVTIDLHKSGFCQYPAGALAYRNGEMKGFITLQAPEVFHSEDDVSVGVYGLEGSKPGAAAAGVLLAHRVLGLDKTGLGRVLGQCQLGAKLFYCMWMTVARDYDDFICLNLIDLPEGYDTNEAIKLIREKILGG